MNKPFLLFQGGTHGNFLAKCLSVASGECDNFDFYKGFSCFYKIFVVLCYDGTR